MSNNKAQKDTIRYGIIVPKVLWDTFKDKIPRSQDLNEAIVKLIENKVNGK